MKLKTLFVVCFLWAVAVQGQQTSPTISFDKISHDFGKIAEENGLAEVAFAFKNTGAMPLIISDVKASCGCTTPKWTREPILPGKSGEINVAYNPSGRPGTFSKTITVSSNATESTVVLRISGEVTPRERSMADNYPTKMGDLLMQSNHVAMMKVSTTEKITKEHKIANGADKPLTLTFKKIPEHLTIKVEPAILAPKQEGKLIVTYDGAKKDDWDYVFDNLQMEINGVADGSYFLTISANIFENFDNLTPEQRAAAPKIAFEEKELNFGTIKQGDVKKLVYTFTNTGKSNLEIRKLKASCGCTVAEPDKKVIKPGEKGKINVTFDSKGKSGTQNKVITVITNAIDDQRAILYIKGNIEK